MVNKVISSGIFKNSKNDIFNNYISGEKGGEHAAF